MTTTLADDRLAQTACCLAELYPHTLPLQLTVRRGVPLVQSIQRTSTIKHILLKNMNDYDRWLDS